MRLRASVLGTLAAAALLSGCATKPPQGPRAEPVQTPPVPPPPAPPPIAPVEEWRDLPLTPGEWSYRSAGGSSEAGYGEAGNLPFLIVACDAGTRQVRLARSGGGGPLKLRTSYGERSLGASGSARLDASDRLLDEIVFSRGSFTVETAGAAMLVVPAWPEAARVIEDCRE
jgi:hypothetical protein